MIKLRERPKCPSILNSQKVNNARAALKQKVKEGQKLSDRDFTGKSYWGKTKEILHQYQHGKCSYCERRRDANAEGDVDHFRPKLRVTERPAHPGYWWLAYEWSNYFFSCKACNSHFKKNHFPLLDEKDRVANSEAELSTERPHFIDPSLEDPADFVDYDWDTDPKRVFVMGLDAAGRGATTIELLGLATRDDLGKGRFETIMTLKLIEQILREAHPESKIYQGAIRRLKHKSRPSQEYLGLVSSYVGRNGLEVYID